MKIKILPVFLLLGLSWSCTEPSDSITETEVELNSDSEMLSQRLSLEGTGVIGISAPSNPSGRVMEDDSAEKLPLVLISQAESPVYEGNTLQATHVDIDGEYAFVSYNTAGAKFLGAVEIINIQDPYKPVIVSQAIFKHADVSAVEYRDGLLFLAMGFDIDQSSASEPANLGMVSVANGKFTSDFQFIAVPGFVATDVSTTSQSIALVSGNNGALTIFDRNLDIQTQMPMEDLRSVAYGSDHLAFLSGTKGAGIYSTNGLNQIATITIDQDEAQAKRTLAISGDHVFIAKGKKGAGVHRLSNGAEVATLSIPINPENVEPGDIVTNAISVENDLIFMANGAAGISVSAMTDGSIQEYGVLDLDGSSNFVRFENNFIFVATGQGGIQILRINEREENNTITPSSCEGLNPYTGNANLNVNSNESMAFRGSAQLKNVNIGGNFLFCGSLAVENNLNINSNGIMEVVGSFAFGQYRKNTSLNINSNSTLKLSGSTVIYGDLRINSGGTLEFVGEGNTITIYGDVQINSGAKVIGNFTDSEGKLK